VLKGRYDLLIKSPGFADYRQDITIRGAMNVKATLRRH